MLSLAEHIAAVKAICENAEELDYRELFREKYESLLWLYDDIRCSRSPEGSYWATMNIGKVFEDNGFMEERNGTKLTRNNRHGEFNPGGSHLRIKADGNIGLADDDLTEYDAKHLYAQEEKEIPSWVSDARLVLLGV